DTIGSCVAVDDKTSIQTHTTYARILVDLDTSKCLPAEINLQIGARLWVQRIDYERLAFRCRRCFQTGHVTDDCEHSKRKTKTAWWRDSLPEHLTIDSNPAKDSSAPLQANSPIMVDSQTNTEKPPDYSLQVSDSVIKDIPTSHLGHSPIKPIAVFPTVVDVGNQEWTV
ncbi:hypothetical protein KI387_040508, partial [Taxus chinensis]